MARISPEQVFPSSGKIDVELRRQFLSSKMGQESASYPKGQVCLLVNTLGLTLFNPTLPL
jgi:hypothetical protein